MNEILLLAGIVIIICILVHRLTFRLGVPSLLAFLALGMCFGVDGILHISFNNYRISEVICSISLIFIMFYGGFGTNFQEARDNIKGALTNPETKDDAKTWYVAGFVENSYFEKDNVQKTLGMTLKDGDGPMYDALVKSYEYFLQAIALYSFCVK